MLDIIPLWGWIAVLVLLAILVLALLLLNSKINQQVREFGIRALQDVNDVLRAYEQTDDQLRAWSQEQLEALDAQAQSLIDKGKELYSSTRVQALQLRQRLARILAEKRKA